MNQRTHTWLAIRAIALLDDFKKPSGLIKLLKPHAKSAAIGSWIPDMKDSKKGSGDIDNHVLKMKPYKGNQKKRFIVNKKDLLKLLGNARMMHNYIKNDVTLTNSWWNKPYKAEPQPGQHLGNRAMSLSVTLIDQLILGDPKVAKLVPGFVRFVENLDPNARTRTEEVATYFFMLSHFVADSCMPCHCDDRNLHGYRKGIHKELETHWSKKVGTYFEKRKFLKSNDSIDTILRISKQVDAKFNLKFPKKIPKIISKDIWKEMIMVCRGSFALANIITPPDKYPYGSDNKTSFKEVFRTNNGKILLQNLDSVIMHDAVLNIAMTWKDVWQTFN